ncbi:MAG TPA: alcohol dehydrogenase catalytic domain-containing protein [Chitinophagaceae bacterium]|nr:alcohol dehydrogenase catalytic domain-containing protein [Chitinophagaceae bacterium]
MKAVVYKKYGTCHESLAICEIEQPQIRATQVLIRVKAASINALDYRRFDNLSRIGNFFESKILKNIGKVPGADISGIVQQVGEKVKKFKPGDEVFGFTGATRGGFAEYACADEKCPIPKACKYII